MGILRTTSKALLVVCLAVLPATAADSPFFVTLEESENPTVSVSGQPNVQGSNGRQSTVPSRVARRPSRARTQQSSNSIFFSPNRSDSTYSARPDGSGTENVRQRMQVTLKPSGIERGRSGPGPSPRPDSAVSGSVRTANAETLEKEQPRLQRVSAQRENPFFESAEDEGLPNLTFDGDERPESSVSDLTLPQEFEFADDVQGDPAFHFDSDSVESEEEGFQAEDSSAGNDAPVPGAVPNTDGSGLPTQHTGVQQPSVEVQWSRQGKLNIGQKSPCSLIVTNTGGSLVRNVTVEAAVPDGVDVVSAVPAPQPGTSRWSVGDLAPGELRSIDMVMIPRRPGDVALNAFVRFTGYSTSVLNVREPMLQIAVEGPDAVTVGELGGYKVRVENPGTGTAHNVVIEAQVPKGLQHRSGSVPRIHVGTLNPGESRQALLKLSALDGGQYRLAVRAVADGGVRSEAQMEVSISKPSLEVSISGPDVAAVGKLSEYGVIVTNTGNIASINVRLKYQLPVDTRFIRADRGGVYQTEERLVDWFVGTIQPGESASYGVTLEAGSPGTSLHRAGVKSEHTDITMVSHSTTVTGLPELYLDVDTAEPVPAVGEESVVRIVLQNEGIVDATNVGLVCELPSGWEFVAAEGPSVFLAESGVVIFRSIDAVKAGGEETYLIRGRCVRAGRHRIRVRVGSPSLTEPLIGEGTVITRDER